MRKWLAGLLLLLLTISLMGCELAARPSSPPPASVSAAASAFAASATVSPTATGTATQTTVASQTPQPTAPPAATASAQPSAGTGEDTGLYVVTQNDYKGVVDGTGRQVLPPEFVQVQFVQYYPSDWDWSGRNRQTNMNPIFLFATKAEVHVGSAQTEAQATGALYDSTGKALTDTGYVSANAISPDYIQITKQVGEYRQIMGLIDGKGKQILPCEYDDIYSVGDVLLALKNTGRGDTDTAPQQVFIFSKDGVKLLRQKDITLAGRARDDLIVKDKSGKYGLMDTSFQWVLPAQWDQISINSNGTYSVTKNGRAGVIDSKGKQIIPLNYEYAYFQSNGEADGYYFASGGNTGGSAMYDVKGKLLLKSSKYLDMRMVGDVIIATGDGTSVALDRKAKEILPGVTHVNDYFPALKLFRCMDETGTDTVFYTRDGKKLPLPEANNIDCLNANRFLVMRSSGDYQWTYGVCDAAGKWIVPLEYQQINFTTEGGKLRLFAMTGKQGKPGLWCMLDGNGKQLLPPVYDELYQSGQFFGDTLSSGMQGLYTAKMGALHGLITAEGKWVWYTSDYNGLMD